MLSHSETGPGQSILGVNEALRNLYQEYDPIGIHFIWDGAIDYIENDSWHDFTSSNVNQIYNSNNHSDGIDIYIGNSQRPDPVGEANGVGAGSISSLLVSGHTGACPDFSFWPQSNVIAHEMGHVLFLYHTFHGTGGEAGTCTECLFEINDPSHSAWSCGDFIYDTPPDPYDGINYYFDINCNYVGGGQDDCGNNFDPLPNNFMSYGPIDCKDSFTAGQVRKMKNALALIPHLQSTQLTDYAFVRGNSITCISGSYSIISNDTSTLTIENSSNISVTTTNSSSTQIDITVTNNDPFADEGSSAYVLAKRNGVELGRLNFWVGTPQQPSASTVAGDPLVNTGELKEYTVPERLEGAENYIWVLPGWVPEEHCNFSGSTEWQYQTLSTYFNRSFTKVGECSGEITLYGINECGDGLANEPDEGLSVTVTNPDPSCPIDPGPEPDIVYYPNPADSLLEVDLSLQEYSIFTIKIYDAAQNVVLETQSENIVKTMSVSGIPNGTYYLHIYDGATLILSKILIINH